MYKPKVNVGHGVMFHYFHGKGSMNYSKGDGSLSADGLEKMIEFLGGREKILDASDWVERAKSNKLKSSDVCLTFDDSLLSQFEIAKPVLDSYKIKGMFFVYSSVFEGKRENLEIYRDFRNSYFSSFDDFFNAFINQDSEVKDKILHGVKNFPENYMIEHECHTRNGRLFRYIRDCELKRDEYESHMSSMMRSFGFKEDSLNYWMSDGDISRLSKEGHLVGLHSYSHPTKLELLNEEDQRCEYEKNLNHVKRVLGDQRYLLASHPSNSYNDYTLSIFKDLGVDLAFRSNINMKDFGVYEYPREDHANIISMMNKL